MSAPELLGEPGGDRVELVAYDPHWPEVFADWRDRLAAALGAVAVRIDHVGSTAVPGLASKPTVDVQVSVPDVEDEASYVPPITSTGVSLRVRDRGHRFFRHRPDRGERRVVHVHVCDAGGRWERDHLLLRDYLRADPRRTAEYLALKRDLAAQFVDDRMAYTDGKDRFIRETLGLAERWAARTGWRP